MQTKSNIQLMREALAVKETFKDNLEYLMDKWLIQDSFFVVEGRGETKEVVKGYFAVDHEYTSLDEAVRDMDNNGVIRIVDNKRFQIGHVYEKLSDVKSEKIVDVTSGAIV